MKQILLGLALFAATAVAQTPPLASQPDCASITFTFAGGNGIAPTLPTAYFDNRSLQCESWTLAYEADAGLTGYTVAFQSAVGSTVPSTFGAYTGNTVNSSPSFGTAAVGLATYCNLATCTTGGATVNTPWIRVLISGATGTGNIRGVLYGYRTGYTGGTGAGGGGGGGGGSGCPNPCPVEGVDAAGAAPTVPPVATAGFDGTDNRRIKTDASGDQAIFQIGLSTFTAGQQAVTGTAANLGTATAKAVCVHSLIANTINVFVGQTGVTTSTGMELPPGQGYCWNVSNTNLLFVIASTTGASVSFTVTN
jgi:hypothetical protein